MLHNVFEILKVGLFFISSTSIVETATVRDTFFKLPDPTTTTSSKPEADSLKRTFSDVFP